MRDYLNNAAPEVLTRLAQMDDHQRETTLAACDRLFAHVEDARDNLDTDDYREFLEWVTTQLHIKALPEVEH